MSDNPLAQYFRVPGIHVVLPSRGAFTPAEELETSMTGELAVYPMAARDEIWAKNPDGLLNGYSIENIIKSCVPGVKNPRRMPSQDIDYLLLAIKKATFGDKLELTTTCPKCKNEHNFECSIEEVMSTAKQLDPEYSVRISDEMVAKIRPYDYNATTRTNLAAFEEAKLLQSLVAIGLPEESRITAFSNSFEKISNLNLDLLADAVVSIVVPGGEVSDPKHIREFLENASKDAIDAIEEGMKVFRDTGIDRKIALVCPQEECKNEWTTELMFDPSHFFE